MKTPNSLALPFTLAAVAALAAAFMPWGEVPITEMEGVPAMPLMGSVSITANGWNSTVTAASIKLPNWTPLLVAAGLAAWAWAGAPRSRWIIPAIVYGMVHAVGAGMVFQSRGGTVGLGVIVTFFAFVAMLVACVRYLRERRLAAG